MKNQEFDKFCSNCKYFVKNYYGNDAVPFIMARNVCILSMPILLSNDRHCCGYWKERVGEWKKKN